MYQKLNTREICQSNFSTPFHQNTSSCDLSASGSMLHSSPEGHSTNCPKMHKQHNSSISVNPDLCSTTNSDFRPEKLTHMKMMQTTGKILVSQAECTYLKKVKAWFAPKLQSTRKRKTSHTCLYYTTHTCGTRLKQCKCRLAVPQCNKYSDIWNIRRMYLRMYLILIPEQLMTFNWWRKCSTWATCLHTVSDCWWNWCTWEHYQLSKSFTHASQVGTSPPTNKS